MCGMGLGFFSYLRIEQNLCFWVLEDSHGGPFSFQQCPQMSIASITIICIQAVVIKNCYLLQAV